MDDSIFAAVVTCRACPPRTQLHRSDIFVAQARVEAMRPRPPISAGLRFVIEFRAPEGRHISSEATTYPQPNMEQSGMLGKDENKNPKP